MTSGDSVVSVGDLSIAYRTRSGLVQALHGVSFNVSPREAYGLVGESGSGKSTAAMALTGYLPPHTEVAASELTVVGQDVRALHGSALRRFRARSFGIVYQEPGLSLNPTMTVGAQIAEVHRLRGASRIHDETQASLARVRLEPSERIARRYPHELSGGQQQRVIIAMALAVEPTLLILDEPTTGLDSQVETEIMSLIDELRRALGFATILISHNLPLIAAHCQRIGVLQNGTMVEEGRSADVLTRPRHAYTRALVAALPDIRARRTSATGVTAEGPGGTPGSAVTGARDDSDADRALVTVSHVSKRYHRKQALRDVSFVVRPGEIVGIVGESGSGKSTLGQAIAGLIAHEGEVRFDAEERRRGRRKLLPLVQIVFQGTDASLNPRRTVRQTLSRSIELLDGDQSVSELAESVGIGDDLLDKLPHQLSGGQKQRVVVARAFAGRVPFVVCDEPTSALDVSIQAKILDLLVELQQRTGVSYLFISHDLAVVRQVSHRIGVLYEGELVELGDAEQIFEAPRHPYTRSLVQAALMLRAAAG